MTDIEELVGGCCVCSDDQGFSNNALVYCDGKGCTVACHTACYGIVSIPAGEWYCRRCEAGEIKAPCRLCPMLEGAMKRTSDGSWAHVICALYIPEVSFGDDSIMEPIILSRIPSTRYEQICSICLKNGRSKVDAMAGACCGCAMKNCTEIFHVTCAQQAGFLYEDVRKNTCQYPIYCRQHQPKFSKFVRQIPAFQYRSSNLKGKPSQLSDFVHPSKAKSNDETSQNSLTNLSQFVELNNDERTNLPSTNQTRTEENELGHLKANKKRSHTTEGGPRPVGRPPSKKKLLNNSLQSAPTAKIDFYPRRPLTNPSTVVSSQRSFPPETLEEFLEQEWQTSSDFLLQQSMPHDVSSLLSCLYQFKSENAALEKQFDELKHRRDSLRVTNANLRRKLAEISPINDSSRLPPKSSKISSSQMDYSTSYDAMHPYPMIKNERLPPTNGISLELLSQILTNNGPQLFAPTWNISNFGYANFPGANSISVTDESLSRSYSSFEQ